MPELFGPLPRHVVADLPLIAAVLAPWSAALIAAAAGPWLEERALLAGAARRVGAPRAAGLVAALGCAASVVVIAVGLARAASATPALLVSPAWTLARVGSLDAVLGFDLDLARGVVALGAAFLGVAHAVREGGRDGRAAAATALVAGGAIAAALADGYATAAIALAVVLAATSFAARGARWAVAAAALGLMILSAGTLAWSLEGRWLSSLAGNYLSDYRPRFAAVRDEAAPSTRPRGAAAAEGRGTLSMTSTPGAEVHTGVSDESSMRSRRAPLGTSPFTKVAVPAVLHKVAVVPGGAAVVGGDGLEIALLDTVDVRAGDDVVLQPVGATLTWRDLDAQLALKDGEARHPLRSELGQKTLAGAGVPTLVLALLFAAALAALSDLPRRAARAFAAGGAREAALVAGALAVAAVTPAARAGRLMPLASAIVLMAIAALLGVLGVAALRASGVWRAGGAAALAAAAALIVVTGDGAAFAVPVAAAAAVAALLLAREPLPGGPRGRSPRVEGAAATPRWLQGDDEPAMPHATPPVAPVELEPAVVAVVSSAAAASTPRKRKKKKQPTEGNPT